MARFLSSLGQSTGERFLPSLLGIGLQLRISRELVDKMALDYQTMITKRQKTSKCNISAYLFH